MVGKRAKILTENQYALLLSFLCNRRHPKRNLVIALLSIKAGLRAGEIAAIEWPMVLDPSGAIAPSIELRDHAAKKQSGRLIPMHMDLRSALGAWKEQCGLSSGTIVRSERGGPMTPVSVCNFFALAYEAIGLEGCSSHSGRRTFITKAARQVHRAGGSLRDVQLLSGHKSIVTTLGYIDGDSDAQRRLVALI